MLAPKSVVPEARSSFSIHADGVGARLASEWLACSCARWGVPADQLFRLDTCLNEAFANIIDHGGDGALAVPVELSFGTESVVGREQAVLSITDAGLPFDPLAHAIGPQAATLEEAMPGGLGLTMIRKFADDLAYSHKDGRNHLTVVIRWPAAPPSPAG